MNDTIKHIKNFAPLLLWVCLLALFLFRYAEPVKDGDLFFHLKYGEYHIQQKTLVTDHSLFSWTPAIQHEPYCTWLADCFLHFLYKVGKWPLLYIFKYASLFFPLFIGWLFTLKMKTSSRMLVFLVLLIALFAIVDAAYIKPDLFSLCFFVVVGFIYFLVKSEADTSNKSRIFLFYPIIFIMWANTHGVFFFGLILLFSISIGELANYILKSKNAFHSKTIVLLLISNVLSIAGTLLTPYGIEYFASFFSLSKQGISQNVSSIMHAYEPLIANIAGNQSQHNLEYWGMMVFLFLIFYLINVIKNRDIDFGILLPSLFLSLISIRFQRSTYYWPGFWALSIFYLTSKERIDIKQAIERSRPLIRYGLIFFATIFSLYIFLRGGWEAYYRPPRGCYWGFGFSYFVPWQESAFIKKENIGGRLFNGYTSGNYLLFDQYPDRKVFIDGRWFPYRGNVFDKYVKFKFGKISLSEMESEFNFDTALVEHTEPMIIPFLNSVHWHPVYYGYTGVVFVRDMNKEKYNIKALDKTRFDDIKNVIQATDIVVTAQNLNDLSTARYLIKIMEEKLKHLSGYDYYHSYCSTSQKGLEAFAKGDMDEAYLQLRKVVRLNIKNISVQNSLRRVINQKVKELLDKGIDENALTNILNMMDYYYPADDALYNAGVITYMVAKQTVDEKRKADLTKLWKELLQKLLNKSPDHPMAAIVKKVLSNKIGNNEIRLLLD